MNSILTTIASSVWFIDETTRLAALPFVARLARGEDVNFYTDDVATTPMCVNANMGGDMMQEQIESANPGAVAILPIKGIITKADQPCGPSGTETFMENLKAVIAMPNISAVVLEMDSGGGEATNIDTVANLVAKLKAKKPIITSYNGRCASAAYYIAAAGTEIYAQQKTDLVGSIGTMLTFADFRGAIEATGAKITDVYADQSTEKNNEYRAALEGNFTPIKQNILNPYLEEFVQSIKSHRPEITDETVFRGATFMTDRAITLGLITGQATLDQVVQRAAELGRANNDDNNITNNTDNNTDTMNKYPKLSAVLGTEVPTDGTHDMTVENLQALENAIPEAAAEVDPNPMAEQLAAVQSTLVEVTAGLSTITEASAANAAAIKAFGDGEGEQNTVVEAAAEFEPKYSWEDPKDPVNKRAAQDVS